MNMNIPYSIFLLFKIITPANLFIMSYSIMILSMNSENKGNNMSRNINENSDIENNVKAMMKRCGFISRNQSETNNQNNQDQLIDKEDIIKNIDKYIKEHSNIAYSINIEIIKHINTVLSKPGEMIKEEIESKKNSRINNAIVDIKPTIEKIYKEILQKMEKNKILLNDEKKNIVKENYDNNLYIIISYFAQSKKGRGVTEFAINLIECNFIKIEKCINFYLRNYLKYICLSVFDFIEKQ